VDDPATGAVIAEVADAPQHAEDAVAAAEASQANAPKPSRAAQKQ
jgi:hypothetical protein